MRKAFIVLAHQMPEQLNLFLSQLLSMPETEVFIHVNKKNESIKKSISNDDRIHISNNNISIEWGSDSILKALIIMLREVKKSQNSFDYVFLSSGQDLLVRNGIDDYLDEHNGEIFIDGYEADRRERAFLLYNWPDKYRKLMDSKLNPNKIMRRIRLELFKRGVPFAKKEVEYDTETIKFYRNWFWCAMPEEVAEYIIDFLDNNPRFWSIYENALVPEEGFFSTIIMNSPYADRIKYKDGRSESLTYDGPRSNGHSSVIRMADIVNIEKSGKFLARKFDYRVDNNVVQYFIRNNSEVQK